MCSTAVQRRCFFLPLGRVSHFLHQRQLMKSAMQLRDARVWATLPLGTLVADVEGLGVASKHGEIVWRNTVHILSVTLLRALPLKRE